MTLHRFLLGALVLGFSGCAAVRVDMSRPQTKAVPSASAELVEIRATSRAAWRGEADALRRYNAAVGRLVATLRADGFAPQAVTGVPGVRRVELDVSGVGVVDPREAVNLVPAADVRIRGLRERVVQDGAGVAFVGEFSRTSRLARGQPGAPPGGFDVPVTAVVDFRSGVARLRFFDTYVADRVRVGGHEVVLAADFSAPVAFTVTRGRNRAIDLGGLLHVRGRLDDARLLQFQPYCKGRVPVVFIHGLLSRPEAWLNTLNELLAEREIRENFQFWFFMYPTGLPVWKSAAILRREGERFDEEFGRAARPARERRVVLVGHSMGGLIASLLIRQGGDVLWGQLSRRPLDELRLSAEARETIREMIFFPPRDDIGRAVFIATPHRGSALAGMPFATFASRLIRLPNMLNRNDRAELVSALEDEVGRIFGRGLTSIRFLEARSPFLTSILNLPLSNDVPYHSIIGDRGRGNTPHSSDGVVPYWSSHLESAASEKIVPSGHGAQEHPEAIAELRRILRIHVAD